MRPLSRLHDAVRLARARIALGAVLVARSLYAASIWHPDAIPVYEGQSARELKRYVLPAFDLLMAGMGLAGVLLGMPSFNEVYDPQVAHYSGWVLLLGGLLALAGISFPRLWLAEGLGKLLILLVLGSYSAALWVLMYQGEGRRWIAALAVTALLVLPLWNLARLGRERRARLPRRLRKAGR